MVTRSSSGEDAGTLDALGYWWVPEHDDHKVPGRFTWDAEEGGHLNLLGELLPTERKDNPLADGQVQTYRVRRTKLQNQFPIIHGEVGRQAFTLLNSFSLNGLGFHDLEESSEHVAVNGVLVGAWYSDSDAIEADRAIFHLRHLTTWVDTDSLATCSPYMDGDPEGAHLVITAHRSASYVAAVRGTEVRFVNELDPTGDQGTHSGVNHAWRLVIASDAISDLETLADIATDIRALVTIGTGRTADVDKAILQHPTVVKQNLAGQSLPQFRDDITYYSRWSHHNSDATPVRAHDLYFNLAELGGPDVVARWIAAAAKYPTELRRVMATRYTDTMYLEDRIANTCAALESFDATRRNVPKDAAKFRERVRASAENVGSDFTDLLVEPLEEWLTSVVAARNDVAHHGARFRLHGTVGEHFLAEQLYWLFAMNMLREAGAHDAAFERIGRHRELRWLVDQARERRVAE